MTYEITVSYTLDLLKVANQRFWIRSLGVGKPLGFLIAILAFGKLVLMGDKSWITGFLGALIVVLFAILAAAYILLMKRAQSQYDEMKDKVVHFTFTDESVETNSDLVMGRVPWTQFVKIWKYREFWLLFYTQNRFVTLPIEQVDAPVRELIDRKLGGNTGKLI